MEGAVVPAMLIGAHACLCQTSSWRLLSGGFSPRFSHRPSITTSRVSPLEISTARGTSPQRTTNRRNWSADWINRDLWVSTRLREEASFVDGTGNSWHLDSYS